MTNLTYASKCDDKINKFEYSYRNNDSMEAMNYSWYGFPYPERITKYFPLFLEA